MSKRKANELTGGTGDVNPQWVGISVVQTGNDIFTEGGIDLPTNPQMLGRANHAVVLEFLRVQFIWAVDPTQSPATPQRWTAHLRTALIPSGQTNSAIQTSTTTIATDQFLTIQGGAGSTVMARQASVVYDMTDGAGHGVIVASKSIVLAVSTLNTLIANRVTCRILYRYKEVTITEFITLAQFQS